MGQEVLYYVSETPYGTFRLFINIDETTHWAIGFGKQTYMLDQLCCWGGRDKSDKAADGTTTLSWEFPAERKDLLMTIFKKFENPDKSMRRWKREDFWQRKEKREVRRASISVFSFSPSRVAISLCWQFAVLTITKITPASKSSVSCWIQ